MSRFGTMILTIACATTLLLGSTLPARAGQAARCAGSLERLDKRLAQCGTKCLRGTSGIDSCGSRCQEMYDAQKDIVLGRAGCQTLSQIMTASAGSLALRAPAGGTSGLWCACKLNCDNDYSGMPVLIRACKELCDKQNKCRKEPTGGGVILR